MSADAGLVLIVDDEPLNVDLLEQELQAERFRTIAAGSGEQALERVRAARPDLILLDVMMDGIDGYETCRRLKADEATRSIPVIFLTALSDTFEKVRAFRAGAVDYLTKPFETEELLARVRTHIALRREIEAHRKAKATINLLVDEIREDRAATMVGDSPAMIRLRALIAQVGPAESTVLIQGETGTGKELVARAIHDASARRERPLVKINCAALPRELVESELFGHEKGAFTGALAQRRGRFELADGGTLFLDEIGEMPLEAQAKLLRVLQERELERVGGSRTIPVDVRVIAATNRNLQAQVDEGRFRADLFYRLNVFPLSLPPLRERRDDIPLLIGHFAARIARRLGRDGAGLPAAFVERARTYDWPGNIRELENLVERALILGDAAQAAELFPPSARTGAPARAQATDAVSADVAANVTTPAMEQDAAPSDGTLEAIERAHILRTLAATRWQIEGPAGAAARLGLNPSTLRGRMRKLQVRKD
jgi:DNA-binding NtrC family response regulator